MATRINGSGKSTLLEIIAGTLFPTSGKVIKKGSVSALLELGAGFNPRFTGRENVYLNASILGIPKYKLEAKLDELLQFAEDPRVDGAATTPPSSQDPSIHEPELHLVHLQERLLLKF